MKRSIFNPGVAIQTNVAPEKSVEECIRDFLGPTHSLQDFMTPDVKDISDLYTRVLQGFCEYDHETFVLDRKTKISFNTYFNSFYEDYWRQFTDISEWGLVVVYKGRLHLEIYRDTAREGCHRIDWKKLDRTTRGVAYVPIQKAFGQPAGRIFADFFSEYGSTIEYVGIRTPQTARRIPRLTVGICTFNRESFLLRNLQALHQHVQENNSIDRIIVVNQGSPFATPELTDLIRRFHLVQVVEQRNLGGCGGFTRTMYESLQVPDASYHLMMDDDAHLDPRVLSKLVNFLSYTTEDVVIGGHMLDLMRPWVLYEAGARIRSDARIKPLHHNVDLRDVAALIRFNKYHAVDYNAWWFCAIPKVHIESSDLPAPIFIRGDDVEYGVRLKQASVLTVAMPGIAIWHEPFYVKVGSWQTYYDYRNRLIFASAYSSSYRRETPGYLFMIMMKMLAVHDYQHVALICMGIEDYLRGPDLLNEDAELVHDRVVEVSKKYQPVTTAAALETPQNNLGKLPRTWFRRRFLLVRRLLAVALTRDPAGRPAGLFYDAEVHPAHIGAHPYVKTNPTGSYYMLYTPNKTSLFHLFARCVRVYRRYKKQGPRVAREWNRDISKFRKLSSWEDIFGTGVRNDS